jgi:hypothetical protein
MDPAHTEYLYFVAAGANPQGHSLFSATLKDQNQNACPVGFSPGSGRSAQSPLGRNQFAYG